MSLFENAVQRVEDSAGAHVDRWVLGLMHWLVTRTYRDVLHRPRLDRALATRDFYADPVLLAHPERFYRRPGDHPPLGSSSLARLTGGVKLALRGPSGFVPLAPELAPHWEAHPENQILHARWWRHEGVPRPLVLCLHGWACGWPGLDERLFAASRLYEAGLDVLLVSLPFHGPRSGRSPLQAPPFPSPQVGVTVEAIAQAVWDIRRLARHAGALAPGRPLAVLGWSLGGLVAALLAGLEPGLAGVICVNPAVSIADLMWRHGAGSRQRARVEATGYTLDDLRATWRICQPESLPPLLTPDRLLVVAGLADGICTPDQARSLAAHWGGAAIHWHRGGHVLQFGRGQVARAVRELLSRVLLSS